MDRRGVGRLVLLVVGVFVLVAVAAVVISRGGDDEPPLPPGGSGLLTWAPRGSLHADAGLIDQANAVWRAGSLHDGGTAPVPGETTYVLWAGTIGAGRVVLLEGLGADGAPLLAQVSDDGDPAVLQLDRVERIPADDVAVVAVTYAGNLDIPGLTAGRGAGLIQVLPAAPSGAEERAIWHQKNDDRGGDLEILEEHDGGMTETFLYVGRDGDPPARLLVGEIGAEAGIAATIEVLPQELFPMPASVELADGPPWGPSGRIDGGEDVDARLAAERVNADRAVVREVAAGAGEVRGAPYTARLVEVQRDAEHAFLVLLARDAEGELACISWEPPLASAALDPNPPGGRSLVAMRCVAQEIDLLVTAVAAPDGDGPIQVTGSTVQPIEAVERFIAIEPYATAPREPLVASLVDDPAEVVTLASLAPVLTPRP